ncbi:MAG: flagellar brake protein [Sulfuricellaceae bacterium]|nr:flagellar brake protein [Sulfuricellaceae bacterium]
MISELQPVKRQEIEVGKPLRWNVYDKDHKLLLKRGSVIRSETQIDVLGKQGLYSDRRESGGIMRTHKLAPDAPTNAPPRDDEKSVSDMHLHIGEVMQLQPIDADDKDRYLVKLIGFLDKRSILVSTPTLDGQVLFIKEGQTFDVRTFSGREVYHFTASVMRSCTSPYPYLHLAFPRVVKGFVVRNATRVKVKLICTVANSQGGEQAPKIPCVLSDLSTSGAQLESSRELGEVGDELIVSLRLNLFEDDSSYLSLTSTMRRIITDEPGNTPGSILYGISFQTHTSTDRLMLENFIFRNMELT